MSRAARAPRRLAVKIALPVVAVMLATSFGLYLAVLAPIAEFSAEQLRENFSDFNRELSGICDAGYTRQLRETVGSGPRRARSAQALAIGEIEDYLRQRGLAGVLLAPGASFSLGGAVPTAVAAAFADGPGRAGPARVDIGDKRYHAATIAFEPWGWRLVIFKDARDYALLARRVGLIHTSAAVILLASGAFLLLALHRVVQRPVQRIVEAVERGERPAASEIAEFNTLGDRFNAAIEQTRAQAAELRREIGERTLAEQALRAREAQLTTLIDSLPFDLFGIDRSGRYFIQNAIGRRMWGELVGHRPEDFFQSAGNLAVWEENNRRAFTGETVRGEVALEVDGVRRDFYNVIAPIMFDGRVDGVFGFNMDITDRKRAEEELARINKLESVGVLAGGIAHDFNNLLTAIVGNIGLARLILDSPAEAVAHLDEAERATARAEGLTRQLLTFARGGAPIRRTTSIGDVIREAAGFALRGSAAGSEIRIAPDLKLVEADEGQIAQVVGNVVLNAIQAMPGGGRVFVSAENELVGTGEVPPLPPGPYVKVSVRDEGPGVPPEVLPRIFDPFFTTKERGTGLGLAIAYAIVRNHGGLITAASPPGGGALFTLRLPASTKLAPEKSAPRTPPPRGSGRVLVMDDDEGVRHVAALMLEKLGYEAVMTASGEEAIDRWGEARERGAPFDAVILDLTVPGGMGGLETLVRLRTVDPGVVAIVSSGYSNAPVMANYAEHGFRDLLQKPFTSQVLAEALHRSLSVPRAGS